jgi:sialate O-acetylesterase
MKAKVLVALGMLWTTSGAASADPLLAGVFQDHMVVQRDRPIEIWGQATAGAQLSVSLGGHSASAVTAGDGTWRARLPAMPAGGPHQLVVRTTAGPARVVEDVLVGDVWLCSGQSNMVLQVHRALDSRAEIAGATDDRIRMLTVPNASSPTPLREFNRAVEWQVTSPETAANFSALCYFFARELRRTIDVPMGLVNVSWGGSAISSWMDEASLRTLGGHEETLAILEDYRAGPEQANARWGRYWEQWWRERSGEAPGTEPWHAAADASWRFVPHLAAWETWEGSGLDSFNGMVWFRTTVNLTAAQAAQPAVLQLGAIEDVDQTFVNGRPIGNTAEPGAPREYPLPTDALRAGANDVLINVLDTYGTGGLHGPTGRYAVRFADGTRVPLDQAWQYRSVDPRMGYPPRTPWEATGGLTTIANAMIAPLGRSSFRGVLWYQGESDVGRADVYARRLAALMSDWRKRFGEPLPFVVVQLAGYGSPAATPVDSHAALLREAQRRTVVADRQAALVVTTDIGERTDIHPANKQEVARRAARAARHLVYGEQISPSGPQPRLVTRRGNEVVVQWRDVDGTLVTYSAARPIGFELCAGAPPVCRYADGQIRGGEVVLDAAGIVADRVRFCWADSPVCNLYDSSGQPAVPFEFLLDPAPATTGSAPLP